MAIGLLNSMSKIITLNEFILLNQQDFPFATGELTSILNDIALASKIISRDVRKAGLADHILGAQGNINVQGEAQQKLDVVADETFINAFSASGVICGIASEENDDYVAFDSEAAKHGKYVVLFDPLDGSSNIDVNVSIGTIFSILKKPNPNAPLTNADFLQAGRTQVAAGYVVYGPQTTLAISLGEGVDVFTLDAISGEFLLIKQGVQISESTREFAINMSNMRHWAAPVKRYVDECLAGSSGVRQKDFTMRWIASMVADVHRVLSRGGVFMYPWDQRDPKKPGKLRLMYEANPMGYLVEQAGGAVINGVDTILDLQPQALHERVSVMLGSKEEVHLLRQYHTAK